MGAFLHFHNGLQKMNKFSQIKSSDGLLIQTFVQFHPKVSEIWSEIGDAPEMLLHKFACVKV